MAASSIPRFLNCLALMAVVVGLVGCGSRAEPMAPVRGQVLLDGKPLTSGTVVTMPEHGPGARGVLGSEGRFTLSTRDLGAGATLGHHRVAVVAYAPQEQRGPEASLKLLVPQKYASPGDSGLSIDVKAGEENTVVLELSSKDQ